MKKDKNISVVKNGVSTMSHKPLPDDLKNFKALFIDEKEKVKNMNLFKRRILGLSSYFRDVESLMPRYNKTDNFRIIILKRILPLGVYEQARKQEKT